MKILFEDDLQIAYETDMGVRITTIKPKKWDDWVHNCMCNCQRCIFIGQDELD